jgi:hypothetical protein
VTGNRKGHRQNHDQKKLEGHKSSWNGIPGKQGDPMVIGTRMEGTSPPRSYSRETGLAKEHWNPREGHKSSWIVVQGNRVDPMMIGTRVEGTSPPGMEFQGNRVDPKITRTRVRARFLLERIPGKQKRARFLLDAHQEKQEWPRKWKRT